MAADDLIPYQSREWVEKAVELTNRDEEFQKGGAKMNDMSVYVITSCPDGTDRITMYQFDKGRCVDWAWEARPHPFNDFASIPFFKQATFITIAPYDFMCKVNRKEIGPFKAMTAKEMKIIGNKAKMLKLIKPLTIWQNILNSVPTSY